MKELSFSQQRLLEAITNCRIYQTRQLLEAGTPAEFIDQEGYSPLLRACFIDEERHRTRTNLIKLLIFYGADVNTTDPQGRHALTYACMTENKAMVQLLLDSSIHNIDLNMKDIDGDTPLIHAVRLGNVQIVTVLVNAMNKFGINMDVRNNADRTPYLEAKRLGQMECAEILLKKGNASRDVQVNPFLELLGNEEEKCQYRADVRGVDWDRETMKATREERDKKNSQLQGKYERSKAKRDIKVLSTNKRLPKRQSRKPRALRDTNPEKNPVVVERKLRSHTTESTCVIDVLREIQVKNEIEPDGVSEMSNDAMKDNNVAKERLSVISNSPFPRVRPSTAATTRRELKDVRNRENRPPLIYNTFLTDGTPVRPASHRMFTLRQPRSKTAPPRRFDFTSRQLSSSSTELANQTKKYSFDGSDEVSWYSHFSIRTSPSVNFMNKIMTMYAEQVSPESSYRKGVKPRKAEDAPTIVAPPDIEHDKHSDGRRSSSGSVRSQSGSGRNRRFSVITKTIASYISSKKALAANKPKS